MVNEVNGRESLNLFLQQHFPARAGALIEQFDLYANLLFAANQKVNLVSRRMSLQDYYLHHFLDSLLAVNCLEIKDGKALDFGSGGGLPGIPIKLIFPQLDMTLLDSIGKKIRCLQEIVQEMNLQNCKAVCCRLEDFATGQKSGKFDYIFCRSVRLEPAFIRPLSKLLAPSGEVVFYKAKQLEDVAILPKLKIYDVSREDLGKRLIVTASKASLQMYLAERK